MNNTLDAENTFENQPHPFKAETRQLLNILVHSLYTEREIFLRELISNASDALTRINFEMLTNRDVLNPQAALEIWVSIDPEQRLLRISDSGIGMTAEELVENLGTIAHSGARAFLEAASKSDANLSDVVGQFGVGFYSAFMVAEWIKVTSRSYRPEAKAAVWYSDGSDKFTVEPGEQSERGTTVVIKLREDAIEFAHENRLREIIKQHSDYIAFPIHLGDKKEQINRQTALWRQGPREIEIKEYDDFYRQLSLDVEAPLVHAHMVVDAPVQMYALLFIPRSPERNVFSVRKQDGLKLYSRKVLIQEYCQDLLPEYLSFVQGVVDSEDLPLNVSRESVQANRIMANLKMLITNKVIDVITDMAEKDVQKYQTFWEAYSRNIKHGIIVETEKPSRFYPLLRFHTTKDPVSWRSLNEYVEQMKPEQKDIYYLLGDDPRSILISPHLDLVKKHDFEVLLLTDPMDAFMLVRLTEYQNYPLVNIAKADLKLPVDEDEKEVTEPISDQYKPLIQRFKSQLGERVIDVYLSQHLVDSPARLVDAQDTPQQELQRVYRLINKDYEIPKKVLEINPNHSIIKILQESIADNDLSQAVIDQIYENALLVEGLHPDPASMVARIQTMMEAALTAKLT